MIIKINLTETHLSHNSSSRVVIIFSNLGELLQVNEPGIVEKLANKYNLVLIEKKLSDTQYKINDNFDPLKNFKRSSKVVLYEFKRA